MVAHSLEKSNWEKLFLQKLGYWSYSTKTKSIILNILKELKETMDKKTLKKIIRPVSNQIVKINYQVEIIKSQKFWSWRIQLAKWKIH